MNVMHQVMNELIAAIKAGKQRGYSNDFTIDGDVCYCSAAIQKIDGAFKAHVSIIKESNMTAEVYEVYFTRGFATLESAIRCIEDNGPIKVASFKAIKGQKIFDPFFNEENGA